MKVNFKSDEDYFLYLALTAADFTTYCRAHGLVGGGCNRCSHFPQATAEDVRRYRGIAQIADIVARAK